MKTSSILLTISTLVALITAAVFLFASVNPAPVAASTSYPRLLCGTDSFVFNGEAQELAVVQINGPSIVGAIKVFDVQFPANGLATTHGLIISGQPEASGSTVGNTLRLLADFPPPQVVGTIPPGSNSFSAECCNEQMVQAPDGKFYHAHYSDVIQQLTSPGNQSEVVNTFTQPDVVGMASDGVNIWISNWDNRQVGTWDPTTNTFTPVFNTPNDAGGLAWDVQNGVLWVGMEGGTVIPYSATGQQLGPGFSPFGSINGTVDGLVFVPAATP
jgi:hypothetical protein